MYIEEVRIPKERIGVLVGVKGRVKRKIEGIFHVKLNISSKDNLVKIESDDSLNIFNVKPVIMAICRGFAPEIAEELVKEENTVEFVNITDYSGKSKKKFVRLKSRIIGSKGKARKSIEELTDTKAVIYGKTIGIIGNVENVSLAKSAFERLLQGAPHGNVYRGIIERKKKFNY